MISIHAPRGGSDFGSIGCFLDHDISIHAPRGGSDHHDRGWVTSPTHISIHAPRGGSDPFAPSSSILPLDDFNPRSPWGERRLLAPFMDDQWDFNPRSPWGERQPRTLRDLILVVFQSTLPVGGATPL